MRRKISYFILTMTVVLATELYFLISLPASISASTNPPNADGCGNLLTVTTSESACNAMYGADYTVASKGQSFDLIYNSQAYYCTNPHPTEGSQAGRPTCLESGTTATGSRYIAPGATATIHIADPIQNACGSAQTDLSFDVFQNGTKVCSYGNPNMVWGWSFCSTNQTCGPRTTPAPMPATITPTSAPFTPTPQPMIVTPIPSQTIVTPIPTMPPTLTPPPPVVPNNISSSSGCTEISQNGTMNNANCQSQSLDQNQVQNNNQVIQNNANNSSSVNLTVAQPAQSQQPLQQTLAAQTVAPAPQSMQQLPSTGGEGQVLFGLLSLIPIGIRLKKIH
ncbi:MAG TPA: hypothetical protein VN711_04000 [Candidatus Saccharimonadales bacterium]|nr:hypothetical protein [Candidatus Saccharimonadales bacterium]